MTSSNGHDSSELIGTTDEEGVIHYFEKVDEFELDGQTYALLIYGGSEEDEDEQASDDEEAEDEGFDEEYLLMKVSKDEEGVSVFEPVEDEAEFEKVADYLENLQSEKDVLDVLEAMKNSDGNSTEVDSALMKEILEQLPHTETPN